MTRPSNLMVVEMKGKKHNECWYSDETAHCKLRTYRTPFKPRTDASPPNFDIKANTNNGGPRDIQSRTGNTPQQHNQTTSSKYTAPNRCNKQVTPNQPPSACQQGIPTSIFSTASTVMTWYQPHAHVDNSSHKTPLLRPSPYENTRPTTFPPMVASSLVYPFSKNMELPNICPARK